MSVFAKMLSNLFRCNQRVTYKRNWDPSESETSNYLTERIIKLNMEPDPAEQNQKKEYLPTDMQKKHVYEVYDKIAPHFSHTRYKPWPKIQQFLKEMPAGSLVYDVGCGNGKYLGVNEQLFMIGTDRSEGLLKTAREKSEQYQLFIADSLYLPVRSEICDAFISIAVIHHFSNDKLRIKALSELIRLLRIGGEGLIYVWAFQQNLEQSVSKKKFTEQDVMVPWNLHFKYESQLEKMELEGTQIDREKKTVVYKRYYHVFKKGELETLLKEFDNIEIVESYYDKDNWCVKLRRVK